MVDFIGQSDIIHKKQKHMGRTASTKREGRPRIKLAELITILTTLQQGYKDWDMVKAKKMLADLYYIILGFKDRDESYTPNPEPNYALFEQELMQMHQDLMHYIGELIITPQLPDYYTPMSLKECWPDFIFANDLGNEGVGSKGDIISRKGKEAMVERLLPKIAAALTENAEDEEAMRMLWGICSRYNESDAMHKKVYPLAEQADPKKRFKYKRI